MSVRHASIVTTSGNMAPRTVQNSSNVGGKSSAIVDDYLRDAERSFTFVDLFAGIGGFHYGVGAAARLFGKGVQPLLVSELEPTCRDVYLANHEEATEVFELGNVMKIPDETIEKRAQTEADILTAGFPCQPFSNSGKKLGLSDPRGQFYGKIEELINRFNTKSFILENVPGIRTNGGPGGDSELAYVGPQKIGKTMQTLERALVDGLGERYNVNWIEIDSSRLGSPQVRRRVYIVGIRKDVGEMPDLASLADTGSRCSFIDIADQIVVGSDEWAALQLNHNHESNIRAAMLDGRQPSYTNGMRRVGNAYTCDGGNVGQAYHAHGLVPTLTKVWARFLPIYFPGPDEPIPSRIEDRDFTPGDGYGEVGTLRRASVREVMSLQGFPTSFKPYPGTTRKTSTVAYQQAGNAVNAIVVKSIARELFIRIAG